MHFPCPIPTNSQPTAKSNPPQKLSPALFLLPHLGAVLCPSLVLPGASDQLFCLTDVMNQSVVPERVN